MKTRIQTKKKMLKMKHIGNYPKDIKMRKCEFLELEKLFQNILCKLLTATVLEKVSV